MAKIKKINIPIDKDYTKIDFNESVSKALSLLKKDKALLVFKNEKFSGIVTKKHLLRIGVNFPEEKVGKAAVMPPKATEKDDAETIATYFVSSGLPKIPVFEKNKIIGVIDRLKFLKEIVAKTIGNLSVDDVATKDVITIKPNDNLAKALSIYKEKHISKLVVFDTKVVGIITLKNILSYFFKAGKISPSLLKNTKVKDVMKTDVYGVSSGTNIAKVIDEFIKRNVSSLIVFNKKIISKELAGIITKTDILSKYLATFKKGITVSIASKIKDINSEEIDEEINKKLGRILKKGSHVFVYLKQGKEKFRGAPIINCRIRLVSPGLNENVTADGWGVDHAIELAITKLKRRLTEIDLP